jgi:hypothetical protein
MDTPFIQLVLESSYEIDSKTINSPRLDEATILSSFSSICATEVHSLNLLRIYNEGMSKSKPMYTGLVNFIINWFTDRIIVKSVRIDLYGLDGATQEDDHSQEHAASYEAAKLGTAARHFWIFRYL